MANLDFKFASDPNKILQDMAKVVDKMKEMGDKADKAARQSKRHTDDAGSGFRKVSGEIAGMVTRYASLGAAVAVVTKGIREAINAQRELNQLGRNERAQAGEAAGLLIQQAGSDPKRLAELRGMARNVYARGATQQYGQAMEFVQQMDSAGLLPAGNAAETKANLDTFVNMSGIVNVGGVAAGIAGIRQNYGGKYSAREILNVAAGVNTGAPSKIPEILEGMARPTNLGGALGFNLQEIGALTAFLSTSAVGSDKGSILAENMLKAITENPELRGKTIVESVNKIRAKNFTPEQLQKMFDARQMNSILPLIRNPELINRGIEAANNAVANDTVGGMMELRGQSPEALAMRRENQLRAGRYFANERASLADEIAKRDLLKQQSIVLSSYSTEASEIKARMAEPGYRDNTPLLQQNIDFTRSRFLLPARKALTYASLWAMSVPMSDESWIRNSPFPESQKELEAAYRDNAAATRALTDTINQATRSGAINPKSGSE